MKDMYKDGYTVWGNYNKLKIDSIPKELINKLSTWRKNMDNVKKIDPFQQMNADFDGVPNSKWIELYTDYSCPKDTMFSLQKYYINNDNTLQLFVTKPSVFNDILYTKDNVLYADKCMMQRVSTFFTVRDIDRQFDATSIYIASNFIKYVNEKNLDIIGNDKGDYLLYIRHDENVLYILQHNDDKFTFVKLQDMLTINDDKKSNLIIDSNTDLSDQIKFGNITYKPDLVQKNNEYLNNLIIKYIDGNVKNTTKRDSALNPHVSFDENDISKVFKDSSGNITISLKDEASYSIGFERNNGLNFTKLNFTLWKKYFSNVGIEYASVNTYTASFNDDTKQLFAAYPYLETDVVHFDVINHEFYMRFDNNSNAHEELKMLSYIPTKYYISINDHKDKSCIYLTIDRVPYVLSNNSIGYIKLSDFIMNIESATDVLQLSNKMTTQNKNTDNDIPIPNLKEIFSHVVPGNVNSIALHDIAKQVDKYTESLPKDTVVPQAFKMDEKGKFVHTGCYEKQNNVLSEESYINKPILGPSINIGPSINNYCLANSFQHTVDKYGIYVISSINHPSISNYEKELLQILSPENCDIINPLTYLNPKGTLSDTKKEIFGINLPAFYNDVDVADTYPTMSIAYNNSLGAPQKEIDTLDKRISEPTFTVTFKEKTIIDPLKLMLYYANIMSEFKEINLNKNIHKSLAPNYERWDARDYNLAAIENNAKRISAEENYITGTLQETEYQPDKQEVTINNLFKGM